jgi:hypothetical protein
MKCWQNKYSGKCWIVGNGPSLNVNEIGYPSFATNRIALVYDCTDWRPTFYYSHVIPYNDEWRADVERSIALGIPCFLHERLKFLGDYDNVTWIPDETYHGLSGLTMAKIATYMGFDDLKFIGHDGNFMPTRDIDFNHFDPEYLVNVSEEEAERWNHKHKELKEWITTHTK